MRRADRSLQSAQALIADDPDAACSRGYYAMLYAARAALVRIGSVDRAMGKSHSGLIAAFSELLVRPGLLPISLSRVYARAQQDRLVADYTGDGIDKETAARVVSDAGNFIDAIRRLPSTS